MLAVLAETTAELNLRTIAQLAGISQAQASRLLPDLVALGGRVVYGLGIDAVASESQRQRGSGHNPLTSLFDAKQLYIVGIE